MTTPVLVVGSVAYDDLETPRDARKDCLGGSATYFSVSASRFTKAWLVGVVGRDFKDSDRQMLVDHQVDLRGLTLDQSGDSFRWGGRYHENMNDRTSLYTHLNVFEHFHPQIPSEYKSARFVFLGNIDPDLQLDVLEQVDAPQFVCLDTMNFWIEGPKLDALRRALARINGLIVNDEEGRLLTGSNSVLGMGRGLQALGPRTVVVKRGEHGALLFHDHDVFFVPGYPLEEVVDPTGAGDTFAGGFMGYLARCGEVSMDNMRRAMLTGSIMASFCVEGFGLERLREVSVDDVRSRYQAFVALTRCPDLIL